MWVYAKKLSQISIPHERSLQASVTFSRRSCLLLIITIISSSSQRIYFNNTIMCIILNDTRIHLILAYAWQKCFIFIYLCHIHIATLACWMPTRCQIWYNNWLHEAPKIMTDNRTAAAAIQTTAASFATKPQRLANDDETKIKAKTYHFHPFTMGWFSFELQRHQQRHHIT